MEGAAWNGEQGPLQQEPREGGPLASMEGLRGWDQSSSMQEGDPEASRNRQCGNGAENLQARSLWGHFLPERACALRVPGQVAGMCLG